MIPQIYFEIINRYSKVKSPRQVKKTRKKGASGLSPLIQKEGNGACGHISSNQRQDDLDMIST